MALARSNLFVVALDRNEQWYRYHHLFQELLRAVIASGRGAWVQAEELTDQALRVIRMSRLDEYPTSALAYAGAARVALHRGNSAGCQELLTRAQRLRPRLTYALPYFAVQTRLELARAYLTLADAAGAATMLREIDSISRRRP